MQFVKGIMPRWIYYQKKMSLGQPNREALGESSCHIFFANKECLRERERVEELIVVVEIVQKSVCVCDCC